MTDPSVRALMVTPIRNQMAVRVPMRLPTVAREAMLVAGPAMRKTVTAPAENPDWSKAAPMGVAPMEQK